MNSSDLKEKHCEACEGIVSALTREQVNHLLPQLDAKWQVSGEANKLTRAFRFSNFYETMAFVNAIAWIANTENHHPDLEVGYNYCNVSYFTHAVGGITHNDFICAAKVDALIS